MNDLRNNYIIQRSRDSNTEKIDLVSLTLWSKIDYIPFLSQTTGNSIETCGDSRIVHLAIHTSSLKMPVGGTGRGLIRFSLYLISSASKYVYRIIYNAQLK